MPFAIESKMTQDLCMAEAKDMVMPPKERMVLESKARQAARRTIGFLGDQLDRIAAVAGLTLASYEHLRSLDLEALNQCPSFLSVCGELVVPFDHPGGFDRTMFVHVSRSTGQPKQVAIGELDLLFCDGPLATKEDVREQLLRRRGEFPYSGETEITVLNCESTSLRKRLGDKEVVINLESVGEMDAETGETSHVYALLRSDYQLSYPL